MAKKILVVDDEQDIRVFLTTLLETSGFKPVSAQDGQEGLEVARSKKPALIIMDIMMPRESGIFLYRELKKDPELKKIPVIIVSALSKKTFFHSQKVLDEYEGGEVPQPSAYIEKPPEADELLQTIQSLLPQ
ncbi:MAG: response regulator [Syntrophobacteraceae bacterium]|nr:response regulator [Syntrophobacteraceae bacterium]